MSRILGYVTPVRAFSSAGEIYMQAASGRVAEALAKHFEKVCVCTRVVHGPPPAPFDLPLNAPNLELIAQPFWSTTAGSLIHLFGIAHAYMRTCRRADVLFVRGGCPYTAMLYFCAAIFRKPICHWIVGDPVTLLRTTTGKGRVLDTLRLALRATRSALHASWALGHQRRIDLQRPRSGPRPRISPDGRDRFQHDSGERIFSSHRYLPGPSRANPFCRLHPSGEGNRVPAGRCLPAQGGCAVGAGNCGAAPNSRTTARNWTSIAAALGIRERIRWERIRAERQAII